MIFSKPKTALLGLIGAAALCVASSIANAEYPERPITVIVPFPAGGITDTLARVTAKALTDELGTNVVVSNKKGGAGTIGLAQIANSRPDGYTVGVVPAAPLVNQPHLRPLPYDANSFGYVCQVFSSPLVLATKPESSFNSLKAVVEYAKQNPGALTYGSPGPGTVPHVAMEQLLRELDIKLRHVPFAGDAPGVTALLGGHIDFYLATGTVVSDKELPGIATFNAERVSSLPEVKTSWEQGYELSASLWGGLISPKNIGSKERDRLANACETVVGSDAFKERLSSMGTMAADRGAKEFENFVKQTSIKNADLIVELGLAK